jgi:hypothetical protein
MVPPQLNSLGVYNPGLTLYHIISLYHIIFRQLDGDWESTWRISATQICWCLRDFEEDARLALSVEAMSSSKLISDHI